MMSFGGLVRMETEQDLALDHHPKSEAVEGSLLFSLAFDFMLCIGASF
jgi:hypothetical protein